MRFKRWLSADFVSVGHLVTRTFSRGCLLRPSIGQNVMRFVFLCLYRKGNSFRLMRFLSLASLSGRLGRRGVELPCPMDLFFGSIALVPVLTSDVTSFEFVSEDERGKIYRVVLPDNHELVLGFTRAGHFRAGHSHSTREVNVILSGKVKCYSRRGDDDVVSEKTNGDTIVNEPNVPHLIEAIEDSWIMDWKPDARIGQWTTTEFQPYRTKVKGR